MSGGHFNRTNVWINDIAEQILNVIENNEVTDFDSWGQQIGKGYRPEVIAKLKETYVTLRRASTMTHRVDYLLAGDDSEDNFLRQWEDAFE
jgi:hypothetical protein